MSKSKQSADLKAQRAAAIEAVEFETLAFHTVLSDLAVAKSDQDGAAASKDELSVTFCQMAADMVQANFDAGTDCRDTITRGFTKHLDALMPTLAAEGSPLVNVKAEDGKDTRYSWKGHGANVKSIAKGVTEFYAVDHDGAPAIINVDEAESFTAIKQSVQTARQWGEDDEAKALREAKEAYREIEATIRGEVLGRTTAHEVMLAVDTLRAVAEDILLISPELDMDTDADADAIAEAA